MHQLFFRLLFPQQLKLIHYSLPPDSIFSAQFHKNAPTIPFYEAIVGNVFKQTKIKSVRFKQEFKITYRVVADLESAAAWYYSFK